MQAGHVQGVGRWLAMFAAFVVVATLAACVTRRGFQSIEVKGDDSVERKRERAVAFMNEQRLTQLKTQLKERLPAVTDSQLDGLGLRWKQVYFKSFSGKGDRTTVTLTVELRHDGSVDPMPIVKTAAAILDPELNPPGTTKPDGL